MVLHKKRSSLFERIRRRLNRGLRNSKKIGFFTLKYSLNEDRLSTYYPHKFLNIGNYSLDADYLERFNYPFYSEMVTLHNMLDKSIYDDTKIADYATYLGKHEILSIYAKEYFRGEKKTHSKVYYRVKYGLITLAIMTFMLILFATMLFGTIGSVIMGSLLFLNFFLFAKYVQVPYSIKNRIVKHLSI